MNFSWRNECNQCKAPKPEGVGGMPTMERGDILTHRRAVASSVSVDHLFLRRKECGCLCRWEQMSSFQPVTCEKVMTSDDHGLQAISTSDI